MRIAVSAETNQGLMAPVAQHFGHAPFFCLVDVQDGEIVGVASVANPHYVQHVPGVVPEFVRSQNAAVLITGGMGQRAIALFEQFGVQPVTGAMGLVGDATERYLRGELNEAAAGCPGGQCHQGGH
jgi:predicted Fe-Mo cluster-binding NifX family protein